MEYAKCCRDCVLNHDCLLQGNNDVESCGDYKEEERSDNKSLNNKIMENSKTQTQLEKDLHQLRKDIDTNIQTTGKFKIKPEQDCGEDLPKCQREIALAYTKLQEGKMWVGKCLEAIGSEFPEELRDKAE